MKRTRLLDRPVENILEELHPFRVKLDELNLDPANARVHSARNIDTIKASLSRFGQRQPIVVQKQGMIVRAGNGRVAAARSLGWSHLAALVVDESAVEATAYAIADNRTSELAEWDDQALAGLLESVKLEFDLPELGFDEAEFDALVPSVLEEGETDPDDIPQVESTIVTQVGDLWYLGEHRLLCGDSTLTDVVGRVLNGEEIDVLFTSPPYAQQREYENPEQVSSWDTLMQGVFTQIRMKTNGQILVNLGLVHREGEWVPYWEPWIAWMREAGWRRFGWYVWDQGSGLPGDWGGRLAPSFEFVFHFNKVVKKPRHCVPKKMQNVREIDGRTFRKKDGTTQVFSSPGASVNKYKIPDSVLRVNRATSSGKIEAAHPAVFSAGFACKIIEAWAKKNELIYDPFVGSGTTIIAAEQLKRRCYAIEIAPKYVDVTIRRWQEFTGKQAVHEESGKTFDELANV